ncbi:hypothetical protein HN51_058364 [Arachis hypogaea]|nr:uncharacterized protein DS421_20g688640 [Arachis hypogaea]
MMVSLEALAMAGASYGGECAMDIEEWERRDLEGYPLPHLLAEDEDVGEERFTKENDENNEDCGVKFRNNNNQEKLERKMEMRRPKCTTISTEILKIALAIICMILWCKKKEEIQILAATRQQH